ncbi:non-canonical purine NTP pyrophosphatase [Haloimpatiens massiliensis]|uniref:non-canonical purine NTP pyrophosphatase n=1 Tax=Haloimpatiens massiliensis TaxID=1658110 RepID=UPI000C833CB8|nr:non-canonical purine NTP pyrophosphatase [Haloimpatiens massiliensis]
MDKTLVYVTGNDVKFNVALQVFTNTGIVLLQEKLSTPEIQSKNVQEVAIYSASWASKQLNKPVIVTDAGFYIEALNGFPGPFIKFVNEWFSAEDYINLMQEKNNRTIIIQDCLAYCCPDGEPVVFTGSYRGKLANEPSRKSGTSIEKIFIPEGYDRPISDIPQEEMISYWSNGEIMSKFKEYLLTKNR